MVAEQLQSIEQAFVVVPYHVNPRYKHLSETPAVWMKLGEVSEYKHLHHIQTSIIKP